MSGEASRETDVGTAAVVCSILEPDAERTARRLARAPAGCALVEIRADLLPLDDLLALVRRSPRELIVTVRRPADGGRFAGSAEERRRALVGALDAGARYVDVEDDGELRDLATGAHADRVILSHHGLECRRDVLLARWRGMAATAAARLKIVPRAERPVEVSAVRELLAAARGEPGRLACFALGRAGALSRVLAPAWGSWATYGAAAAGAETAPGQLAAEDLLSVHDVAAIGPATRLFALIGSAVSASPSPAMHAAAFREAGLDARYLPLELDRLEDVLPLVGSRGLVGIEGLAVTMPFKEEAAARCAVRDAVAERSGAVNTVRVLDDGWRGANTDGPAILALVRRVLDPRGAEVAVVGAGGTARVAAAVLAGAGGRVTVFNRSEPRRRALATALGVRARGLGELRDARWDVLVQATPAGGAGERLLPADALRGRLVLDAVYGSPTPLVADARARGVAAIDGLELLVAQAVLQHEILTGHRPREATLRDAAASWLARAARA